MIGVEKMQPIVEFSGVTMDFPGIRANDDVSLSIRKGEIFALVGENGAGKSTLMNILYGILTPTAGQVRIKGETVTRFSPGFAMSKGVGMVHQHFMLVPSFTVAQNIVMSREPRKMGIFFDEEGRLDSAKTQETLGALLRGHTHAVVPGFYGCDAYGNVKTFSRGGSDITGSIVARAIKADIYENWTDVSGMLMADPRCVENPKVISTITYSELRELSYMGATVMHEDAIFPVREMGIPINIRNTNSPEDAGTMIVSSVENNKVDTVITGVAGKKGFSVIAIEKDMMNSEVGFGRTVLEVLENYNLCFEHLPSGIDTMSVVVNDTDFLPVKDNVVNDIYRRTKADSVTVNGGIALVAVVGRGMAGAKGTAGRLFKAIAENDINIKMIDQGSSELNIIVGISEDDYIKTLNAIYHEFVG